MSNVDKPRVFQQSSLTQEPQPPRNPLSVAKTLSRYDNYLRFCAANCLKPDAYRAVACYGIPETLPRDVRRVLRCYGMNTAQAERDYQAWRNWRRQQRHTRI